MAADAEHTDLSERHARIVGREREQALLRARLDRLLAGQGGVVLVSGEAGIGKSTLVADLGDQAAAAGVLVLWGHAYDLSVTPPYGPWLEILHRYPAGAAELPAPPAFLADAVALAQVGSQERLFTVAAAFFAAVADQRPLLLVLDDLHWADHASLAFLRFLARQVADRRLLVVAIYRTDELHRQHPLAPLLPLLVREAAADRVALRPLTAAAHRVLIRQRYRLAAADETRLETYLAAHAEGNPLYALELLRHLEEEQLLRPTNGAWQLGDLGRVRVPPLLLQLIERRLARLAAATRALLQVAAVIGQEVPLDLWQQVSGAPDEPLDEAIAQGSAAHLLLEAPEGAIRFAHALIREALYAEVGVLRRRRWHGQVAAALVATRRPNPDTVAYHFQQADSPHAAAWLINAGERAQRTYAWHTAAARFAAALAVLTEHEAPAVERATLLYRLANMLSYTDERRALALLDEARQLATEVGEQALASHFHYFRGLLQCFNGDLQAGLLALDHANTALGALSTADLEHLRTRLGS